MDWAAASALKGQAEIVSLWLSFNNWLTLPLLLLILFRVSVNKEDLTGQTGIAWSLVLSGACF